MAQCASPVPVPAPAGRSCAEYSAACCGYAAAKSRCASFTAPLGLRAYKLNPRGGLAHSDRANVDV